MTVLRDVAQGSLLGIVPTFQRCVLPPSGRWAITLMMVRDMTSEMSVNFQQTAGRYIPEGILILVVVKTWNLSGLKIGRRSREKWIFIGIFPLNGSESEIRAVVKKISTQREREGGGEYLSLKPLKPEREREREKDRQKIMCMGSARHYI
jgi:hypothetical protein